MYSTNPSPYHWLGHYGYGGILSALLAIDDQPPIFAGDINTLEERRGDAFSRPDQPPLQFHSDGG